MWVKNPDEFDPCDLDSDIVLFLTRIISGCRYSIIFNIPCRDGLRIKAVIRVLGSFCSYGCMGIKSSMRVILVLLLLYSLIFKNILTS